MPKAVAPCTVGGWPLLMHARRLGAIRGVFAASRRQFVNDSRATRNEERAVGDGEGGDSLVVAVRCGVPFVEDRQPGRVESAACHAQADEVEDVLPRAWPA